MMGVLLIQALLVLVFKYPLGQLCASAQPRGPSLHTPFLQFGRAVRVALQMLVVVFELGFDSAKHMKLAILDEHLVNVKILGFLVHQGLTSLRIV